MSCLRDAWRSTIDNLKFLTMKKFFLINSAICLSCAALMAEPVSKQMALQIASQVMDAKNGMKKAPALNTLKAEAVFGKVDAKGMPRGILLVATAPESPGYRIDWYVNGAKQGSVNGGFLSFSADDDCRVEARYLSETGVIDVTIPTSLKDDVWYDLQGRWYVEKPTQHCIYILNGKKIMMR